MSVSAQIQHLLRKVMKHAAGCRQGAIFRRPIEQRLAEFAFKPANCLADGRLSPIQGIRRARKTFLARNAQKHFQLIDIHLFDSSSKLWVKNAALIVSSVLMFS